jgi:MYXO-CTERM domain-containing protein
MNCRPAALLLGVLACESARTPSLTIEEGALSQPASPMGPWVQVSVGGPGLPAARYSCGGSYDPGVGMTLVFGGTNSTTPFGDLWGWSGVQWKELNPGTSDAGPAARQEISLAYDSARQRTVMFGGSNGALLPSYFNDTWEWNGSLWLQLCVSTACSGNVPQGRSTYGLAFDPGRGVTVLYGGAYINFPSVVNLGDTWEWDGVGWTERCSACAPGVRNGPGMAYDPAQKKVLMFGGNNGNYLADTWEWDGSAWTQQFPTTSPSPRANPNLVTDSIRNRIITYGGGTASNVPASDTWEWDGLNWTLVPASVNPGSRFALALAFDTARGRAVLFGGSDGGLGGVPTYGDTWEYLATNQPNGAPCIVGSSCDSGFCTDAVCCQSACGSQCQMCQAGTGNCLVIAGSPVQPRPPCLGDGGPCTGACPGGAQLTCAYPTQSTSCGSGSCASGIEAPPPVCDGAGVCKASAPVSCSPYVCSPMGTTCLASCSGQADCIAGDVCVGSSCEMPGPDAGLTPDAGGRDAGPADAGAIGGDSGAPDAGGSDGGAPDTGALDSGRELDAGVVDAGAPEPFDIGCGCGAGASPIGWALLALGAAAVRRRR